jgi:hypothetical protein
MECSRSTPIRKNTLYLTLTITGIRAEPRPPSGRPGVIADFPSVSVRRQQTTDTTKSHRPQVQPAIRCTSPATPASPTNQPCLRGGGWCDTCGAVCLSRDSVTNLIEETDCPLPPSPARPRLREHSAKSLADPGVHEPRNGSPSQPITGLGVTGSPRLPGPSSSLTRKPQTNC